MGNTYGVKCCIGECQPLPRLSIARDMERTSKVIVVLEMKAVNIRTAAEPRDAGPINLQWVQELPDLVRNPRHTRANRIGRRQDES